MHPAWTDDGSPTLVHAGHGEACHSRSGAWSEARARYAAACRLAERARLAVESVDALRARDAAHTPGAALLRLIDVGTGLGYNVAAALEALDGSGVLLDAHTFELEREPLERAAELGIAWPERALPADLARWHAPVRAVLAAALAHPERAACDGFALELPGAGVRGRLRVHIGDARECIEALPSRALVADAWAADAVFLDPFSPGVDGSLWQQEFLSALARRMASGAWLSTYTVSLAVRERLARAGLAVGAGPPFGAKRAGTLASPDRTPPALDERTRRRLARRLAAAHPAERPPGAFSGPRPRDGGGA